MAETDFLKLYKKDPILDRNDTFNITTMLNDNWDKLDTVLFNMNKDKVDKITGKGLSKNDFTDLLKEKLDGVEKEANKYIHPATHPASIITESTTKRFVSDTEKSNWNSKETVEGSQAKVNEHEANKNNPHVVTKAQIGLGNVDNVKQASKLEFDTLDTKVNEHLTESMPHQFVDGAKTYKYGLSVKNGVVMMNYEEVI